MPATIADSARKVTAVLARVATPRATFSGAMSILLAPLGRPYLGMVTNSTFTCCPSYSPQQLQEWSTPSFWLHTLIQCSQGILCNKKPHAFGDRQWAAHQHHCVRQKHTWTNALACSCAMYSISHSLPLNSIGCSRAKVFLVSCIIMTNQSLAS